MRIEAVKLALVTKIQKGKYIMARTFKVALFMVLATMVTPLFAQLPVHTQKVEMSIPFGVVPGQLVTVGDLLLFIDDEKPEASFAIARSGIRNLSIAAEVLTVETVKPVRDRGGERSSFNFRLTRPMDAQPFADWFKTAAAAAAAPAAPGEKEAEKKDAAKTEAAIPAKTYQARHTHFPRGGCNGRLVIEANRMIFESISDIDHSRQWDLKDIKEIKRSNPYSLKIVPFSGNEYNLELQGQGMDSSEFKGLVDRITSARLAK